MMREEFEERIKDIEEQDYRELFTLMFYTGLRIGEAMALFGQTTINTKRDIHK